MTGRLHHAGNVRQRGGTFAAEHSQRPQLATADIGHRGRQRRDRNRHVPAERRGGGRTAAVERHVRDVDTQRQLEQFASEMRGRATAGRGVAVFAGACLGQRHQFVDALGWDRGMHHQHMRRRAHQRNRLEVLVGIVGDFRIEADIGDEVAGGAEDRIAVRRGARGGAHGDVAAAAGHVLDVERLPETFRQLRCDQPRRGVALPAGAGGDDDPHRAGRIGLRRRALRLERQQRGCGHELQHLTAGDHHGRLHAISHSIPRTRAIPRTETRRVRSLHAFTLSSVPS